MKESKNLEFKSGMNNTFLKTVSAYANYGKGIIRFGVNDDGSVCGIDDINSFCLDLENKINDSISPKPDFLLKPNYENNTIDLIVNEGMFKPYFYKFKAYKRNDTSTIEVDQVELKRLILEGQNLDFEELEVNGSLSFKYLENKIKNTLNINLNNDILKTLGLVNSNDFFNNAALLLSDNNNFPGIDIICFGDNINIIKERITLNNISLLEQYDKTYEVYKKNYQYELIDGQSRKEVEVVPENAFREALANALIHRSWDEKSSIKISMYKDKIDISSPGGLPHGISKEEYLDGRISKLRNPILANVFFRLKLIEKFGTGILRIKYLYNNSIYKPEFLVYENSITIVLPSLFIKQYYTLDEKIILDFLSNGLIASASDIAIKTNLNKSKVLRLIKSLKDKKLIKTLGVGKATRYYL